MHINHYIITDLYDILRSVHQWTGRPGFNPRSSHTKDSKMVLDASLFKTQHYKIGIKGKVEQSRKKGVVTSSTPRCCITPSASNPRSPPSNFSATTREKTDRKFPPGK